MAWTAPRTWVTGETVTAALLNAHVRDNLLETSAATVTTAGDVAFADAANSMGSRLAIGAATRHMVSDGSAPVWRQVATDVDTGTQSDTGTSFSTLANWGFGGGSEVEVTLTTGTAALVLFKGDLSNDTGGSQCRMSYSISGATTVAAGDTTSIFYESSNAADAATLTGFDLRTGLTAGSNVFTLEGRVSGNTGTIVRPEIVVAAF